MLHPDETIDKWSCRTTGQVLYNRVEMNGTWDKVAANYIISRVDVLHEML